MNFSTRAVLLFFFALLSCTALMAQSPGSLRGQVLDPSGAAVPKASVTVTGPNGLVKVATADNDGNYVIAGLPAGTYTVRVTATGFTLFEKDNVEVSTGRPVTLNTNLSVEAAKQEVTVADTQNVELDPAKNAGALVLKQEDLDMLSDDPDDLQADLLALAGPAAGPNGGQIFIDGFSNGQLPPKESIREVRINSNPFSAEYDTSGRGRIEILTKPGTGAFHGTININYSDWMFDARNPFITSPSFKVPASDTKNLQANFSGPIIKNKLSFFIDFSRRQQREDSLINSELLAPSCSSLAFPTPYCPTQTQAYAIVAPNTFDAISPRVDYQLSQNITLQGRYTWHGTEQDQGGVGGFNLPNTAYVQHGRNQMIQLTETQVVNTSTINETRFQYFKNDTNQIGTYPQLNISVLDAFTTGSSFPRNYTNIGNYELQNYTTITHGTQFIKFGVRLRYNRESSYLTSNFDGQFNFDSLSAYGVLQQGLAQNVPLSTIFANGGQPYQYVFNYAQNPLIKANQFDAGPFFQDDWRVKPNITLSLGMRYEVQNNIPDHGDWAPRIGLAWGLGPAGRLRNPKTVLRAGFGYFYDRFSLANVLNTLRYNGTDVGGGELSYTITNPQFYLQNGQLINTSGQVVTQQSLISPLNQLSSATYHIPGDYQSPRMQQSAIGLDRQLPKNVTLSVNYINSIGTHVLRTVDINTPLPGTWNPLSPTASLYPLGQAAGIYNLYESGGMYKQNQLIFNGNARINSRISLFGFYVYGHVNSNVIGTGGSPSNPYNFNQDWGRANYDIRNRVVINGTILTLWGIRMSPNILYNSAPPYNITEGIDQYGDTLTNARPALEPAGYPATPSCTPALARSLTTCVVSGTPYGNFLINPPAGVPVIPINAFNAFRQFNFNLRLSRTWGFGESTATANQRQRPGGGGPPGGFGGGMGRGGGGGGRGPGGPGGMFGGGDSSGKRYNLTAGIMFHNLFNTVNPGAIEGDLLSPRIGDPLAQANVGGFGGNQNAQAFNRRIDFSLRFQF